MKGWKIIYSKSRTENGMKLNLGENEYSIFNSKSNMTKEMAKETFLRLFEEENWNSQLETCPCKAEIISMERIRR